MLKAPEGIQAKLVAGGTLVVKLPALVVPSVLGKSSAMSRTRALVV
jgi:hypothetical protein